MVWGCFKWFGQGPLGAIKWKQCILYYDTVDNGVPCPNLCLQLAQLDNAPVHKERKAFPSLVQKSLTGRERSAGRGWWRTASASPLLGTYCRAIAARLASPLGKCELILFICDNYAICVIITACEWWNPSKHLITQQEVTTWLWYDGNTEEWSGIRTFLVCFWYYRGIYVTIWCTWEVLKEQLNQKLKVC